MTLAFRPRARSPLAGLVPLLLGGVVLSTLVVSVPASQAGAPSVGNSSERVAPRSASDGTLGSWTPMGITVRTGDDSFQDPGLNQAVYALVK